MTDRNNGLTNVVIAALAMFSLLFYCGCATENTPDVDEMVLSEVEAGTVARAVPEASGGIVMAINSMPITAEEVIEPIKEEIYPIAKRSSYLEFRSKAGQTIANVFIQKVTDIKLYEKAMKALPENINEEFIDNVVEEETQKFIARHGGNYAKAQNTLEKMGLTWKSFREDTKRAMLVQSFVSEEVKTDKPITHSQLLDYYASVKNEYEKESFVEFRLIDIELARLAEPNDAAADVQRKAEQIVKEISAQLNSGADFAEMAKKYSNGHRAASGGLWEPVQPGSLVEPFDAVEKAAEQMSLGEVKGPIFAGEHFATKHIFIVKLENKQSAGYVTFEQVQEEIEARLMLENRKRVVNEMMSKIMQTIDMTYAEDFIEFCCQMAYKKANQQ
ncbi:MAG: peptidylprolyl isomerase [Anaerohalosphaeraceae bacterium]|nr:peptidylprolyl isomerase [Anaerohalosphaeraceae bacterium]